MKLGGTVWIRLARPEDSDAVAAMHERCSESSLYRRYLTAVGRWRDITCASSRAVTGAQPSSP
jgi:hypothetical protein